MNDTHNNPIRLLGSFVIVLGLAIPASAADETPTAPRPGLVRCANLAFAGGKTSRCFSAQFLADVQRETNIWTEPRFTQVEMASAELFDHPFAVMSCEGSFQLADAEIENLRRYLIGGGFLVVSAGCSSKPFQESFEAQIKRILPDHPLRPLELKHPVFHTVYDIDSLDTKRRGVQAKLHAIELDGRVALVYSPEGLNDTANAGGDCCCCGENEVLNARQINANLLAYALTH